MHLYILKEEGRRKKEEGRFSLLRWGFRQGCFVGETSTLQICHPNSKGTTLIRSDLRKNSENKAFCFR
jgi:hypothetical protein